MVRNASPWFFFSLMCLSCSSDDDTAEGSIAVTAYGESFIEDGIPESEMTDDWEVEFDRFTVTISDVALAGQELASPDPVDLTEESSGEGQELGRLDVSADTHSDAEFTIERVEVEGQARKGDEVKTFDWSFTSAVRYESCETETSVSEGETSTFQITVHADHLFYDSLVAEEPNLVFQPLADADADEDGEISQEELESTGIGAFDPGNQDEIEDLWAWLTAQTMTLGHVDGEGHCESSSVD